MIFANLSMIFEAAFAKTGAIKGAESVKVDLAAEEEDIQNLEDFAKNRCISLTRIHKKHVSHAGYMLFSLTYDLIIDRMTCMKYQSVFLDE